MTQATITDPAIHVFDSTGEAYDDTQTRDDIRDGDVLLIPSEGVVGFLNAAWPVAVTEAHGALHTLKGGLATLDTAEFTPYAASIALARQVAAVAVTGTATGTQVRAAAEFLASWDNVGGVRPGVLQAVIDGHRQSVAIVRGAPGRYSAAELGDWMTALAMLEARAR